jgi:hypothetical protein
MPIQEDTNEKGIFPLQTSFVRLGAGWITQERNTGPRCESDFRKGELVAPSNAPSAAPTGLMIHYIGRRHIEQQNLDDGWGWFFPGIPRAERGTYAYPTPLSEEFWRSYAEPLDRFFFAALLFNQAIRELHGKNPIKADDFVNFMLARVNPAVTVLKNGSIKPAWGAGSLLAWFALMALQDVSGGWRMRDCGACGKQFAAHSPREQYCSVTCRRTQQMRRYRKRLQTDTANRRATKRQG